jgi:hypothetical protein
MPAPSLPRSFKLRPEEDQLLKKAAAAIGVGPATYVAETVRAAIGTTRVRPLPKNHGEVAEAVREATGAIGRVGNNVNQLARVANSGGPVDATALAPIQSALASIDAALAALAKLP